MSTLKELWEKLGGKVGLLVCLAGFVAIYLGWNGAAGYDRLPSQIPYLFGGLAGVGLVVLGSAMVMVDASRQQRREMLAAILAGGFVGAAPAAGPAVSLAPAIPGTVVAGRSAYHRPDCRLLSGRDADTTVVPEDEAVANGLTPCRICRPGAAARLAAG